MTFTLPSEMRSATFCSCTPTHGQATLLMGIMDQAHPKKGNMLS